MALRCIRYAGSHTSVTYYLNADNRVMSPEYETQGPPGYEAEQIDPAQPSADQQSWRAEKKAEIGRGVNMPAMILNLDSSKHSYSSARFDNQPYWRFVSGVQNWVGRIGLDRMECVVIREAELAGELEEEPDDCQHSWGWIQAPQVDPTKEMTSERGYLQNQTVAWSDAVTAHGEDPDRVLETLARDAQRFKDKGLPTIPGIPDPSKAAGAGASSGSRETFGGQRPGDGGQSAVEGKEARGDAARSFREPGRTEPERFRGDGNFYGNQYTGSLGKAKLAPNGGNGGGNGGRESGPKRANGLTLLTKEEARDFHKKSGESRQDLYVRVGESVKKHLDGAGLPVKEPLPATKTSSVYLKGKQFDVRISDGHDASPKKQSTPPAKPVYELVIEGSGIGAAKVNKLLTDIVAAHKKARA